MNRKAELNPANSKSKFLWWRTGLILGIIILGTINFGCEKAEYYVRYAVGLDSRYYQVALDIEYKNDKNGTTPISATDSWSIDMGPLDKDFSASLLVATEKEIGNTTLLAKIYVSKDDGPFVLKASGESDTSEPVQIEYAIDF